MQLASLSTYFAPIDEWVEFSYLNTVFHLCICCLQLNREPTKIIYLTCWKDNLFSIEFWEKSMLNFIVIVDMILLLQPKFPYLSYMFQAKLKC